MFLIVLKIFTSEFYSIGNDRVLYQLHIQWLITSEVGALFAVYGAGVLGVSAFRRMQGNRQFFSEVGEDGLSRKRYVTTTIHDTATLSMLDPGAPCSNISEAIQLAFRALHYPAPGAQI